MRKNSTVSHTAFMKITTILCASFLIVLGISSAVYAFWGVDLLLAICFFHQTVYRAALAVGGVCALWLVFWLIAFRPLRFLS